MLSNAAYKAARANLFPSNRTRYADDPALWAKERLGIDLWSSQVAAAESLVNERYTAVQSCHGAGKSFSIAVSIAHAVDTWHDPEDILALWTAPSWNQVGIVGEELRAIHARAQLPGTIGLDMKWRLDNGKLIAQGRKPADTDIHGFQGWHRGKVVIAVDEACGVAEAIWNGAEALMTNDACRMGAYGNPDDPSAYFADICKPGSGWNRIRVDGLQTPNITAEVVADVPEIKRIFIAEGLKPSTEHVEPNVRRKLIDRVWIEERIDRYGVGSPMWDSKVRGVFPKVTEDTLITPAMISAAHRLELPGMVLGRFGLDVARFGSDYSVMYWNRGGQIRRVMRHGKESIPTTAREAMHAMNDEQAAHAPVLVDVIGVGGGVKDIMSEAGYDAIGFDAAARASEPERFVNVRAEAYWHFRNGMEANEIDLDEADEALAVQLQKIRFKIVNGRIQIEAKDDMKKRMDGKSPDEADACIMSWYQGAMAEWDAEPSDNAPKAITAGIMKASW